MQQVEKGIMFLTHLSVSQSVSPVFFLSAQLPRNGSKEVCETL